MPFKMDDSAGSTPGLSRCILLGARQELIVNSILNNCIWSAEIRSPAQVFFRGFDDISYRSRGRRIFVSKDLDKEISLAGPRIAYLTSGAAGMFCGSCMRDNTLAAALLRKGGDITLIPTYTPIRTDEQDVSQNQVFFGGINVYLQDRYWLFRWLPRTLDRWLNSPSLLARVATGKVSVDASQLADMTVSMLRGENGRQRKEVGRLVDWLADDLKPEVINLTNILIAGFVPTYKRRRQTPVVVTLQGDDLFLEYMPESYRKQARAEIRRLSASIDGYIVFSNYYADFMADYLGLPRDRFHIVPMGLHVDDLLTGPGERPMDRPPTLGFFARISPEKGFDRVVDAFLALRKTPALTGLRLRAAGWLGESNRSFFESQVKRIREAGALADFDHAGELNRDEKGAFLRGIDVMSAPTSYREPKGIFVLESLACATPVVQPAHGAFPELLAQTGGGILFDPNDRDDYHAKLGALLQNRTEQQRLGNTGQANVRQFCTDENMAEKTLAVYQRLLAQAR